jgi:endonuclease VIII
VPEGHTIHRLARDHAALFAGRRLRVTSPQGRFAEAAARVDRRRLETVDAHGKHLFYQWATGDIIHVHLGLFGKFFTHSTPAPPPRETVRLRLSVPAGSVDLVGATDCSLGDPDGMAAILSRLGPDPIRDDGDPETAWPKIQRRASPIGLALMDQSVVSGVGNVYRAEALFVHGIHPARPAREITHEQWLGLWRTLQAWLRQAVEDQVIITVPAAEIGKPRETIRRGEALYAYKQERCRRCGTSIRRWDLGGRWAYACESCQPPPR